MLIHSGERPHICSVCKKGFARKQNLQKHMKIHTKEDICSVCGDRYANSKSLENHMKAVHRAIYNFDANLTNFIG